MFPFLVSFPVFGCVPSLFALMLDSQSATKHNLDSYLASPPPHQLSPYHSRSTASFPQLFLSYAGSFFLFGLLGVMVSNKHQRRKNSASCLLSLHGAGGGHDALENGSGNGDGRKYGGDGGGSPGGGGSGRGRRAPSMCELVRRTLSRSGSASQTSSFGDFGDFRGGGPGRGGGSGGGYGGGDDDDLERIAFLDHHDSMATSRSALLGATAAVAGGEGSDNAPRGARGAARRPLLLPRGRSSTRGDGAALGRGSGRTRGAAAAAAATVVDSGGYSYDGSSVSSTKMR